MEVKILYRKNFIFNEELNAINSNFAATDSRVLIKPGDLVIPRYSSLPYYNELENDIKNIGGKLINSYCQHLYVANFNWYYDLKEFTPETWFSVCNIPKNENGPFVLKGCTNSQH